ncbi:MAG: adenylate/guanylate cyclase domain-containing protein [Sulfuricurvum sp.]|uniref:CHASE2 domain-containing protein n=1 Tax=Sulfuricurvum sp. TaxID=2025608 RepID=UPI002628367B|nr:adenylate/guanylate cyclase domain-containing protein [Sulfuricurvum sp.]MDD2829472.1 adenylate/guanylate cyclase domain-containing protein [Sulfuricurvum sp.]MDD4948445.1 adenylate/guanylate cyclase domain-containing protein [Sulfuricurvum sp.]
MHFITYRLTRFILFVLISATILYGYLFLPATYQNIDDKLRDFLFIARGVTPASEDIVIVDIDEKSLESLGQWPWERNVISRMLQNLTNAEAGIIGLDIVFSESDKSSPHHFAQQFHLSENVPNYDLQLAKTVSNTPTILGYVFKFDQKFHSNSLITPDIPAIFIEKNLPDTHYLLQPFGILTNLESIQKSAYSSGFINNVPDASGNIRSVPLIMRYNESIYPSLAFEMFRIANNAKKVTINYSPTGVSSIFAGEIEIPTDRNGRMYLNHRGPAKTFHYLSASDIVNNTFDPAQVKGKYILVGTSAYGLMDLRSNPFDNIIPGIEIHATLIDNLIQHDMLLRPEWIELAEIGMILALCAITILGLSLLRPFLLLGGFIGLLTGVIYLNYTLLFTYHIILNLFFTLLTLGISIVAVLGMNYFFEQRQKERVKKKFAQKVSEQVMEDLMNYESGSALQTRQVDVTIFFSDIRSFTLISETLGSPETLVSFLNQYMTVMVEPIIQTFGTIDKFIGDAIMAYWNAPNHVENHADMGVKSALKQLQMREALSQKLYAEFGVHLDFGIGLNTGAVTVGDIGSEGRSDYTIIGDPVNLASRLEGLCKYYHVRLIISENTYHNLKESYIIRELDRVRVKGKTEPIRIYEVLGEGEAEPSVATELEHFHQALEEYQRGAFMRAMELFATLEADTPHPLYTLYKERCIHLEGMHLETFDGIYEFHEK